MTRMIRGSVLLAACVGLWSCSSDSTSSEAGVPDKIVSLPSVIFVKQDSSELVAFQLVDALDGQIPTEWTVAANSPLFTVAFDSTYRPVYNPDGTLTLPGQQTEARATITGVALGIDTLTVTASGKTLDVIVNVVPGALQVTFSPANPAPGDTVTMTMPAGTLLSQTSVVTFTGNQAPIIVDRAADSTSLRFISAPTTATFATVTKVWDTNFPTNPAATYNTEAVLTGTMSGAFNGFLPGTFSTLAPSGPPVLMTMNAGFGVLPTTVISFTNQTPPIINNANVTGDSTQVSFSVGPNVNQKVNVTQIYAKGAPQFLYTLESTGFMVSPVVLNFPATTASATPVWGDTVTITLGAGYKLSPTSAITWAARTGVRGLARSGQLFHPRHSAAGLDRRAHRDPDQWDGLPGLPGDAACFGHERHRDADAQQHRGHRHGAARGECRLLLRRRVVWRLGGMRRRPALPDLQDQWRRPPGHLHDHVEQHDRPRALLHGLRRVAHLRRRL